MCLLSSHKVERTILWISYFDSSNYFDKFYKFSYSTRYTIKELCYLSTVTKCNWQKTAMSDFVKINIICECFVWYIVCVNKERLYLASNSWTLKSVIVVYICMSCVINIAYLVCWHNHSMEFLQVRLKSYRKALWSKLTILLRVVQCNNAIFWDMINTTFFYLCVKVQPHMSNITKSYELERGE